MMKVRVTKFDIAEQPHVQSGTWDTHVAGHANAKSLPVGYWLEGYLLAPVSVGFPIVVFRTTRNGIDACGLFESSAVKHVAGDRVETANSVYRVERAAN